MARCDLRIVPLIMPVAVVIFLALLLSGPAFPQDKSKEPAWHSMDTWRQPQGLPQNSVLAILQTRDGYLWVGTQEGLVRFNGVQFTVFDKANQKAIKHNDI